VFLGIIHIHSLSNVCVGQPVVVITMGNRRFLIGEVDVRLRVGIAVQRTQWGTIIMAASQPKATKGGEQPCELHRFPKSDTGQLY
jgi:hypothetical protein